MASLTKSLALPVLIPAIAPFSTSTISKVCGYLRFGFSDFEYQTRLPGSAQFFIEPVLGQWIVSKEPSGNLMSAKKRLYRLINLADDNGGDNFK